MSANFMLSILITSAHTTFTVGCKTTGCGKGHTMPKTMNAGNRPDTMHGRPSWVGMGCKFRSTGAIATWSTQAFSLGTTIASIWPRENAKRFNPSTPLGNRLTASTGKRPFCFPNTIRISSILVGINCTDPSTKGTIGPPFLRT